MARIFNISNKKPLTGNVRGLSILLKNIIDSFHNVYKI